MEKIFRNDNIILFSIRRPFSQLIIRGEKKYELRKRLPRSGFRRALIYETHPTKAIVGYFEIGQILEDSIENIWEMTKGGSFVSREFFDVYFKDKQTGVAFEIKESRKLERPVTLSEIGVGRAPQDFMYVESEKTVNLF